MKKFRYIWLLLIGVTVLVFAGVNIAVFNWQQEGGRTYRVAINRACQELKAGKEIAFIEQNSFITEIARLPENAGKEQEKAFFQGENTDYVIRNINGSYYRIAYKIDRETNEKSLIWRLNLGLTAMTLVTFFSFGYLRHNLVEPFSKISEIPYELSKGNLTTGLKENKNRFFGRFIWGLDLLRETLEEERNKELKLQQEKQTLILSISHDIKTPLSVIKLYAKALVRNLYDSEEKRMEIAENINKKADEIENFVSEIVKASNEEFLNLEVKKGEFYLKELTKEIRKYYQEKLELLRIPFSCEIKGNCLVKGDLDRAVEVLQNIMENAIKYGDGGYISIELMEEEDCRLVVVKNSGCSIKKEELPHVFDSFWRGSNTEGQPGSGLGLYICRQLMQKMDGDIYAHRTEEEMQITVVFRMI